MNSSWSSFSSDSGPSPEDVERLERFQRAMAGPPDNVVPVAWPFTVMLARSEEAAVPGRCCGSVSATPTGRPS